MSVKFRKEALDHMASPEQLDQAVPILRPVDWMVAVILVVMATALVVWSVVGELAKRVNAAGLIINSGGQIVDVKVPSNGSGSLSSILIKVGDMVQKGDVVAILRQEDIEEAYQSAMDAFTRKESEERVLREQLASQDRISREFHTKQKVRLQEQLGSAERVLSSTRERVKEYKRLFDQKVVTRTAFRAIEEERDRAVANVSDLKNRMEQMEKNELLRQHQAEQRLTQIKEEIETARARVNELEVGIARREVRATKSGRVTEIKANTGSPIAGGQSIMSIETKSDTLEVLAYIEPQHGKKVEVEQEALIGLGGNEKASDSRMYGTVTWVSEFPVSREGIVAQLQNDALAQALMAKGAPYEVRIELQRDPTSENGYAWTSKKGREATVTSGGYCYAKITYDTIQPLSMVVPLLKELVAVE